MKRFLIFCLPGPPRGFVVGFWGLVPLLNWATGAASVFEWGQLVLLPLAYWMGFIPALLAAVLDRHLTRRGLRWRPAWTALFAFAASFVPLAAAIAMGFLASPWLLIWGLIGAVPGFICSALSGASERPQKVSARGLWPLRAFVAQDRISAK
ncbi:MAG: hypothetical protein JWR00_1662 [Rubritepida sp.]|nr:hypothetical protein [Rubritepida sp.]